jgi:adenylate kinase
MRGIPRGCAAAAACFSRAQRASSPPQLVASSLPTCASSPRRLLQRACSSRPHAAPAARAGAHLPADSSTSASAAARSVFDAAWSSLESGGGGASPSSWPREVLLLCGAPGAGKGSMAALVKKEREIAHHFEVSSLLQSPEMLARKAAGALIDDKAVTEAVIRELAKPHYAGGVIIDGYPRTEVQAEVCALLCERLAERARAAGAAAPRFSTLILYVNEEESVRRQLARGRELQRHNEMVRDTGVGESLAVRPTDVDEAAARARWRVFKDEVYASLQVVKHRFAFHYCDASFAKPEVERRLRAELAYKPQAELSSEVFAAMSRIETAADVAKAARSAVVQRINTYARENAPVFRAALDFVSAHLMGIIRRQGACGWRSGLQRERECGDALLHATRKHAGTTTGGSRARSPPPPLPQASSAWPRCAPTTSSSKTRCC